jgi:hypothetical protein
MIQAGDILAVRGSDWLSDGIALAEYGNNEPVISATHVGIFVAGDPIPVVIEALNEVKTNPLAVSLAGAKKAYVIHDDSLTMEQRQIIIATACTFSAKNYGYIDIAAQGLDAVTHTLWFTDELGGYLKHYPICSYCIAEAYDAKGVDLHFGITDANIRPSDIVNFVLEHPNLYQAPVPITAASLALSHPYLYPVKP